MSNEMTEITLVNPKQSKPTSLWANMLTLIFLFSLIMGAKELSEKWLNKTPPTEDQEKQIVMEDLENEKPLAESEPVEMAATEGVKEIPPSEKVAPELAKQASTNVGIQQELKGKPVVKQQPTAKVPAKKSKVAKQKVRAKKVQVSHSIYAEPDPYTNGGPLDLDHPKNRNNKSATATPPTPLDERDRFIPFESK